MRNYVTVSQLLSFLDIKAEKDTDIMINHEPADSDTKVYENFTVELLIDDTPHEEESHVEPGDVVPEDAEAEKAAADTEEKKDEAEPEKTAPEDEEKKQAEGDNEDKASEAAAEPEDKKASESVDDTAITVIVNDAPITLSGKKGYVFVDVFDHIDFDLSKPHGKMVITKKNGMRAEYSESIKDGDRLEIYWEK